MFHSLVGQLTHTANVMFIIAKHVKEDSYRNRIASSMEHYFNALKGVDVRGLQN